MSSSDEPIRTTTRRTGRPVLLLALLLLLSAGGANAVPPTVNGWFYGDGDDTRYQLYSTSDRGSKLYTYYDAATHRMYVALVVNQTLVNDLVCDKGPPGAQTAYVGSAGWSSHRSCKRASDSEFATFTLQCAPGSANAWTWQQGLACNTTAGPPQSNWVSDATCTTSSVASTWPPSILSNTSFVQNVNTYQATPSANRAWNMYVWGTDIDVWKSPFVTSAPNDVTQVPGYPTFSSTNGSGQLYNWEWSMVYEWSVNLGSGGANCGDEAIVFIAGTSHHSPPKVTPTGCVGTACNDDPFTPPPGDPTMSDWGDDPASYGTTSSGSGARHYIKVNGPYLGQNIQAETDGTPTTDATGDGDEEDGVTANVTGNWTVGSTQSFTVTVANAPSGALLGGWFDWNHDGDFADAGEFFQWNVVNGVNVLNVTVGSGFDWSADDLYTRFRIFSSGAAAPGGSLSQADFIGTATDGEVEDYVYGAGQLPVTMNAFASEGAPGGEMTVRWQTASETENVAFELWGRVDGEWKALSDLVATHRGSSGLPQSYEVRFDAPAGLTDLQLVDYDTRGRSERFGTFRAGESYGEVQPVKRVDWSGPRARRDERLSDLGFVDTVETGRARGSEHWKKVRGEAPVAGLATKGHGASALEVNTVQGRVAVQTGPATHVAVTEPGVQRVTYEALRDGGLDLAGVNPKSIAVTLRGAPVARWIGDSTQKGGKFGPGSAIEFVGRPPSGQDALYIDAELYQVSVDGSLAREAGKLGQGKAKSVSSSYSKKVSVDRPALYHPQSPTGDPWVDRSVLVRAGQHPVVALDLPVAGPMLPGTSRLSVGLGTITDLPDLRGADGRVLPEHNVEVWLRGADGAAHHVADASTSGQRDWRIEGDLPEGWLQPGLNQVELRFSTEYFYSLVVVDSYGVGHPAPYLGPSLDFAPDPWGAGYRIEGFATPSPAVYAEGADGSLTRVESRATASAGGYAIELRDIDAARVWVTEVPRTPSVFTTAAPPDLLSGTGDLVVIAGSSFVGTAALDDYLAQRAGFDPVVVDVEDVYNAFGYGMATPSAITAFLAARDAVQPFTHVQLVGTDCYDRLNHVSQCLSFIPLPTAPVGVNIYSPSQNRLVDLDGDGVGDKAIGQFSVRDESELATIVEKGAMFDASGVSAGEAALMIAEESDGLNDFAAQIDRLSSRLAWSETDVLRMADHPSVQTARTAFGASLASGRAVTVFSGHSSPSVWAFRALLTTSTVAGLTNGGRPTIMVPLACETTYDISPSANVLGHQLLFGGDRGALAISGAVALSSLNENEQMANHVLDGLKGGLTLGEAVLSGRRALGASHQELQDNWITQGDVAARLEP